MNAILSALSGLAYIASHRTCRSTLIVSRGLPAAVQRHLLGVEADQRAVSVFLALLESQFTMSPGDGHTENGLCYVLFSSSLFYWGFAGAERQNQIARHNGWVARCIEHFGAIRKAARARDPRELAKLERKYQKFKSVPNHAVFMLPLFFGSAAAAYAKEQLAIRLCPSELNRRERRPDHLPKKKCRLLHRWERGGNIGL